MMARKKKGSVSEEDTSQLLQRYTATTILALLQEVYQFAGRKIDWDALVKKSSTGISSAWEYQMLWRHLAYHNPLLENVEDRTEPLDDDSDIEFELEAVPSVSGEASSEAAACVKVLISSGLSNDCGPPNRSTVEAPLTINIPNGQTSCAPSDEQQLARGNRGTNITVPVSVQKQPLPIGTSTDGVEGNASAGSGMPAKKKRKLWTKEEDEELIAAVQKYGEGNWANILKGDFKHDRTASQLSQRWSTIRKRQGNLNPGGANIATGSTQSDQVLATRKAVSMALNMPTLGSLSATNTGMTLSNTPSGSSPFTAVSSEAAPVCAPQTLQETPNPAATQKGVSVPMNKSRITVKKIVGSTKSTVSPNPLIQAAAFAAGGRIATASTAASLFKAAKSKAAVHFRPCGSTLSKPSVAGTKLLPTTSTPGLQSRYSRPTVMPPPAVYPGTTTSGPKVGGQQVQESSGRPGSQPPPTSCATASNSSVQQMAIECKPGSSTSTTLQENADRTGNEVAAVDLDEMDIDDTVARDHQTSLDVGEIDYTSGNAGESRAGVGLQKDLSNSEAAESQSMVIDAGETQPQPGMETQLVNGEARECRSVENTSSGNNNVAEEQLKPPEATADVIQEHQ